MNFDSETDKSYYKYILSSIEYSQLVEEKILVQDNPDIKEITEINALLNNEYVKLNEIKDKLIKNQDMFITMKKYLTSDINELTNQNDCHLTNKDFKFKIDHINKENNAIFKYIPSYKSNYIPLLDKQIFGYYSNIDYLLLKYLENILSTKILCSIVSKLTLEVKSFQEDYNNKIQKINVDDSFLVKCTVFNNKIINLLILLLSTERVNIIKLLLEQYHSIDELVIGYSKDILEYIISNKTDLSYITIFNQYSFLSLFLLCKFLNEMLFDHKKDLKEKYSDLKILLNTFIKEKINTIYSIYAEYQPSKKDVIIFSNLL